MVYPRVVLFVKNRFLSGTVYGILVWLVMNLIVVPLSRTPHIPFSTTRVLTGAAILIVCVGIPISLSAHSFFAKTSDGNNTGA